MRDRLLPLLALVLAILGSPAVAADQLALEDGTLTAAIMPGHGREAMIAAPPKPLGTADARAYAQALKLQAQGRWAEADMELNGIRDGLLKGHVLAQRYLGPGYRSKFNELHAWMDKHSDHPQAEAIHRLAVSRAPRGAKTVKAPVRGSLQGTSVDTFDDGANWENEAYVSNRGSAKIRATKLRFRQALRRGDTSQALATLSGPDVKGFDRLDMDEMRLVLAADHFASGRDAEALDWAVKVAERSGMDMPASHWIAALSLWRQGHPDKARYHFEKVANAEDASPWMVSAGAFWAARANLVSRRPEVVNHWLEVAATYPRTFYGLLARRTLGYDTYFSWETPPFTEADAEVLLRVPGARRALALLQLGEAGAAEEELRKAYPRATKAVRHSMLVLAHAGGMPALAVRLGGMNPALMNDSAAFPVPEWKPKGGWLIDKALVFAIVRQESSFNPNARSRVGAAGLMQIMPRTATGIGGARDRLGEPEYNLALGQKYLAKLLEQDVVEGNLFKLAVAYNAGPGNLAKWLDGMNHGDDPLLFIESVPSRETRVFIERVLANFWTYRARMGQDSPSLEALAAGQWPLYEGMDKIKRGGGI